MTIAAVVMAGGKGTRMKDARRQKVLRTLAGRPMVLYTLDTLHALGLHQIVVVVGHLKRQVMAAIEHDVTFAVQREPLGTGHAMQTALAHIPDTIDTIFSVYGDDSAFYTPRTLKAYMQFFHESGADIACLTVRKKDPTGLGRIIRNASGDIERIVEEKFANAQEKKITEVNTGAYLFRRDVLDRYIPNIQKNETGEYFLTDIVELALRDGKRVVAYPLKNPNEWHGVNNPSQLRAVDRRMRERQT